LRLANSAISRGDFEKAIPFIAKAMSLDPGNPEAKKLLNLVDKKNFVSANYTRGVEAYSKDDYGLAVQYLQMVYETDPQYRDVASLYHDAQSHYQPLESMSKEMTDLYAKGVDYYMNGDYANAIDVWQKVLEKNPKNYLVQRNIEDAKSRVKDKVPPGTISPANPETKNKP
jgi:tetratricopeptide (TPR) repeat protein